MKDLKEIIFGTMTNGPETLNDIKVSRKNGQDFILEKGKVKKTIEQLHLKRLKLVIDEIIPTTKNSKSFRFISKSGYLPPFQAGQYINVFIEIDGIRTSRPYSISSSPKQKAYFEITIARISDGFVSDYFLDKAKVGLEVEANGPAGVFYFNPVFHSKKSVFLAGGSGITPFMSMTKEILESGMDREIYLIYGVRNTKIAIFHKELSTLSKNHSNFHYDLVVSDNEPSYKGKIGFIDAKCIKSLVGNVDDKTFYICGPQVMSDFCQKALKELNVRPRNIRHEMFGIKNIQNETGWPTDLNGNEVFKLKVGDKIIDAKSSESILTSLEKAGIRMSVCCRSGECSLCRVKLVSGKVFMPRGVLLRLADEKFGFIHSCKAYPISDVEIMF